MAEKTASSAVARLAARGIDLMASYGFEAAANVAGGERRRFADSDQLVLSATIDAGKAVGLPGGTFQGSVTYRRGRDLSEIAGLGTLQQVQEVYGRGQTWRLTQLWYSQILAGGAADVKLGRLTQGEDFAAFPCEFMNLTFCGAPAGNLVGDYWFNWPISQWGARLRVKDGGLYAMAGVYENNPRNLDDDFVVGHFRGATGVLLPAEVGLHTRWGPRALPGTYKLGGWYNTSDGDDVRLDVNRQPLAVTGLSPLRRKGRHGVYLQIQQQLSGAAADGPEGPVAVRGLVAFLNVTQTDRQTSRIDNQVALGISYTGLFAARPNDHFGLAVGRTNVNGRVPSPRSGSPHRALDAEYAVEVGYGIHATSWLNLRPNVQYVVSPGGDRSAGDVIVLGLKGAFTI